MAHEFIKYYNHICRPCYVAVPNRIYDDDDIIDEDSGNCICEECGKYCRELREVTREEEYGSILRDPRGYSPMVRKVLRNICSDCYDN